jgi:hypothetical protein
MIPWFSSARYDYFGGFTVIEPFFSVTLAIPNADKLTDAGRKHHFVGSLAIMCI